MKLKLRNITITGGCGRGYIFRKIFDKMPLAQFSSSHLGIYAELLGTKICFKTTKGAL